LITITEGTKAVINDPGVVATAEKVLKAAFGDKFWPSLPVAPSEHYSEFINPGVPSMFFRIGVYEPKRALPPLTKWDVTRLSELT
jgi:hippurate hydrolase